MGKSLVLWRKLNILRKKYDYFQVEWQTMEEKNKKTNSENSKKEKKSKLTKEEKLEETLRETFPASDAPANY